MNTSECLLGMMSGTSLDGVDIIVCNFNDSNNAFVYEILASETFEYSEEWNKKLQNAEKLNGQQLILLHNEYGRYLGFLAKDFIEKHKVIPSLIASHGHTIFHQPEIKLTYQIGSGAEIAQVTGITTVCDFRSQDVAFGGQGAPLVPIGDELLFSNYEACINLGGFANISFKKENTRIAFDISPCNILLNRIAQGVGLLFDKNGELGKAGIANKEMLHQLGKIPYYEAEPPKSLGKEWLEQYVIPIENSFDIPEVDLLRTYYEHISDCVAKTLLKYNIKNALLTGGGAFNTFLIERVKDKCKSDIIIPDNQLIEFKEALIFALLGYLRVSEKPNTIKEVTGASTELSAGVVYTV
jgi:anhydro-N-acetylmuramic acid kinase